MAGSAKTSAKKSETSKKKIFVLDTSVILYDHNSIQNFQEHDVAIPITVLEELDEFKKGNDTKNYEAREFIRFLDRKSKDKSLTEWISLNGGKKGNFKVIMNAVGGEVDANRIYMGNKMDHQILNACINLKKEEPTKRVILVTKDINLRLKAKALDIEAEDYETGKIKDLENLYTGKAEVDGFVPELIDALYQTGSVELEKIQKRRKHFKPEVNQFFILRSTRNTALAYFNGFNSHLDHVPKHNAYGIKPRNAEQAFAIHALLNKDIKLVAISGVAGTGKTLLALAAALEQRREFRQIYLARPIVPLSNKDIGYLPGDMKAKINPYMQPLWDNLKFIKNQWDEKDKEAKALDEMVENEKIVITPLAYIRGRSLSNIFFIVDEAQNLTPHEIKTIITRAGENTKIVFTGDIFQIDTPYLDEQSNGLSYMIHKLRGQKLFAHIALEKGERSELANLANELL